MSTTRPTLPPANSIVAFEAAARLQNFTLAARELNVTQPAISRQIRRLEDHLGFKIFRRKHGRAALTDEGDRLYRSVAFGLAHIADTIADLSSRNHRPYLTLGTTLAFANYWLVPRLEALRREHPDIQLRLIAGEREAAGDDIDLEVRFGNGAWPQCDATLLLKPAVIPVCSPSLLRAHAQMVSVEDLISATVLDRENPGSFGVTWDDWLIALGVDAKRVSRRIFFNSYDVLIRAAIAGQGVALGWNVLVEELIREKLLVCPLAVEMRPDASYFLVCSKNSVKHPDRDIFQNWIEKEASKILP